MPVEVVGSEEGVGPIAEAEAGTGAEEFEESRAVSDTGILTLFTRLLEKGKRVSPNSSFSSFVKFLLEFTIPPEGRIKDNLFVTGWRQVLQPPPSNSGHVTGMAQLNF